MTEYLIHFAQKHVNFRIPELKSILDYFYIKHTDFFINDRTCDSPFLKVRTTEDVVHKIASRSILIKEIYEFWASGTTKEECYDNLNNLPNSFTDIYYNSSKSWSLKVCGFGKKYSLSDQEDCRMFFSPLLKFAGPISLNNNEFDYRIIFDHGERGDDTTLKSVFFLRFITNCQRILIDNYSLKKRAFLGPTSMDTELSLIMANMGHCGPNKVVYDPYVGTGSILVACSHFKSFCYGTDIDIRILIGKNGKTLFTNFDQYHLPRPEIIRADFSTKSLFWDEMFDAIVCDPPYGIRAGARKSGSKDKVTHQVIDRETHIPQTQPCSNEEVLIYLLNNASRILKRGGRLVYLLPTLIPFDINQIPPHPCLRLLYMSEQGMTRKYSRFLLTMEKIAKYDNNLSDVYLDNMKRHLSQYDLSFVDITRKIREMNGTL